MGRYTAGRDFNLPRLHASVNKELAAMEYVRSLLNGPDEHLADEHLRAYIDTADRTRALLAKTFMTPSERLDTFIEDCLYVPEGGCVGWEAGVILRAEVYGVC